MRLLARSKGRRCWSRCQRCRFPRHPSGVRPDARCIRKGAGLGAENAVGKREL